ncbi:MAG: hypothetical protein JSR21_17460, partial [Proteobacteria bacterium]|nr:hypothetical protein [Pseudomonadota bacterium]
NAAMSDAPPSSMARAREAQRRRHGADGPRSNAEVDMKDVALSAEAQQLAERAMEKLRLSPRGYTRVLRVARSIADLDGATAVGRPHIAEALAFRQRPTTPPAFARMGEVSLAGAAD